jgi:hypothetical protein
MYGALSAIKRDLPQDDIISAPHEDALDRTPSRRTSMDHAIVL